MDGRGQVCYTSSDQSETSTSKETDNYNVNVYNFSEKGGKGKCEPVNPYSCVDIVEKIESTSEQLIRNLSHSETDVQKKCKGSTVSLPACKFTSTVSHLLDNRAKSTDNNLDFDQRRLSSTKETKEYESSDIYSEDGAGETYPDVGFHRDNIDADIVLNMSAESGESAIVGKDSTVSQSGESAESHSDESTGTMSGDSNSSQKGTKINSYIRFGNKVELVNDIQETRPVKQGAAGKPCTCGCHRNNFIPVVVGNGYVSQDVMVNHAEDQCSCRPQEKVSDKPYLEAVQEQPGEEAAKLLLLKDHYKNGCHSASQVYNLPPHFFGSMSSVPVDPARTTEL